VRPSGYFRRKAVFDRLLAALLLVPVLLVIGLLVVLVRLTSRGPAIYRQSRVGKDGRIYPMLKIRTMRVDAESHTGAVWTLHDDPRITPVGKVLRKLHLDEFPQLLNVLRGEMSLIGPRPERPEFVHVLEKEIPEYCDRLLVSPGITGLAQINLPPDSDLDSVRRKLVLDFAYIQEASSLLDLRILFCTLLRAMGLSGSYAMRLCRLQRQVVLPKRHDGSPAEAANGIAVTPSVIAAQIPGQVKPDGKRDESEAKSANGNGHDRRDGTRKHRSARQRA
jgi:lipopolysaccharide/colanic/teichoic acid biosynthesis glycosyltransferase